MERKKERKKEWDIPADAAVRMNTARSLHAIHDGALICRNVPRHVVLDLGNVCNQRCRFCNVLKVPQEGRILLSADDFEGFSWLGKVERITFSGFCGEVLANRNFPAIVETIRALAPATKFHLYSNGLQLDGENLETVLRHFSQVHLSVNAVSREAYGKTIVGGDFDRHMRNIRELARRGGSLRLSASYVVTRHSAPDLEAFVRLMCELGFDEIRPHLGYHWQLPPDGTDGLTFSEQDYLEDYGAFFRIDDLSHYAAGHGTAFFWRTNSAVYHTDFCDAPWRQIYLGIIQSRPAMHICCGGRPILFAEKFRDFADIGRFWNHERIQEIRRDANNLDKTTGMCAHCRYHPDKVIMRMPDVAAAMKVFGIHGYDGEYRFFPELTLPSPADHAAS